MPKLNGVQDIIKDNLMPLWTKGPGLSCLDSACLPDILPMKAWVVFLFPIVQEG